VGSFDEAGLPVQPNTYLDVTGLKVRMDEIAAAYPAIAKVVDITATYATPPTAQGRHLYALKISDNVDVDEDEPAMLIVANFHAREIGTPVIALTAADRLTAGYETDPAIQAAVNSHEIWIAPTWNPDGYNHVFTTDNMWRKNRRVFSNGGWRRSEPQLLAGMELVLRRQHERQLRNVQGPVGSIRSGNANDDGVVAGRAVCEADRLSLLRA
jgi:hypothetical protein